MAFPTQNGVTSGDLAGSTTTRTLTLPGSIVSGELLLALAAEGQNMSHTWPAGWSEILDTAGFSAASRVADGSEAATIDVTTSLAGNAGAFQVHKFTGGSFLLPQQAGANFSNTVAADPPNLSPSWAQSDVLWCAITFTNNASGTSGGVFPTSYSDNQLSYGNSGGGIKGAINFASRNLNAASEDPGAYPILGAAGRAVTLGIVLSTPSLLFNPHRHQHLLVR